MTGKRAVISRHGTQQIAVVVATDDGEDRERAEAEAAGWDIVTTAEVVNVTEARDRRKAPKPLIETIGNEFT